MTDNGPAYRAHAWRQHCAARGLRHLRTRPYTPRTNGKAERFIQLLLHRWAYAFAYPSSAHRTRAPTARWAASRPSAVSHTLYVPASWIRQGHSERAGTDRSHLGRKRPLQSRVVPARTLAQSPNSCRGREHEPASARQGAWPALPEGTQWRHQRT